MEETVELLRQQLADLQKELDASRAASAARTPAAEDDPRRQRVIQLQRYSG
jgi:hypothetical protein